MTQYKIEVDCANCAAKMEAAAQKTKGVKEAAVNYIMQIMFIEFEDGADPAVVMPKVRKACLRASTCCEVYI